MTLVELLVILVILGLAVGIAVPTLLRSQIQARANREMANLQRMFDLARSEAMRLHQPTTLGFTGSSLVVQDAGGNKIRGHVLGASFQPGRKPAGVPDLSDYPLKTTFVYNADGSLQGNGGGAFYFSDKRGNFFRLATTAFTGRPRAEMWTGTHFSPRRGDWEWK